MFSLSLPLPNPNHPPTVLPALPTPPTIALPAVPTPPTTALPADPTPPTTVLPTFPAVSPIFPTVPATPEPS